MSGVASGRVTTSTATSSRSAPDSLRHRLFIRHRAGRRRRLATKKSVPYDAPDPAQPVPPSDLLALGIRAAIAGNRDPVNPKSRPSDLDSHALLDTEPILPPAKASQRVPPDPPLACRH